MVFDNCSDCRQFLELFFGSIVPLVGNSSNPVHKAVEKYLPDQYRSATAKFPKMAVINRLLLNDKVRVEVWKELELPETIRWPTFKASLLYGHLSEWVHDQTNTHIIVSSSETSEISSFFAAIGKHYRKIMITYSDELAEAYEHEE